MLDEPLGLTVHSLPVPQEALARDGRAHGARPLEDAGRAAGVRGAGDRLLPHLLRDPARGPAQLRRTDRPAAATARHCRHHAGRQAACRCPRCKGQWLLVSVAGGACDAPASSSCTCSASCARAWARTRTASTGSGWSPMARRCASRCARRWRRPPCCACDAAQLAQWLAPAPGQQLADHLYVVDPMGNWMMRFPAGLDTGAARPRPSATWSGCCAPRRPGTSRAATLTRTEHGRAAALRPVARRCTSCSWAWWSRSGRCRGCGCATSAPQPARRLQALTVLMLFLTFDLVLFGAFTRLTDSGLGCPDWPGCYGNASPERGACRRSARRRRPCRPGR